MYNSLSVKYFILTARKTPALVDRPGGRASTNYPSNLGSTFFACLDDLLEKAGFLTVSSIGKFRAASNHNHDSLS
jgi:hypothetical protein